MKKLKIFVMIILCIFMVSCDSNTQSVDSTEPYYSETVYVAKKPDELPFDYELEVGERYTQFIPDYEYLNQFIENHFLNLKRMETKFLDKDIFKDNYVIFTASKDISANKYYYYGLSIKKGKININYKYDKTQFPGGTSYNYTFIKVPKSIFPTFFNHKRDFLFDFNFEFDDNSMYYLQYNYDYNDFINFPLELDYWDCEKVYGLLYTYNEFLDFSSKHGLNKYYIDETFFDNHFAIYNFYRYYGCDLYNNFSYSGNTIYLDSYGYFGKVSNDGPDYFFDITFIPKSLLKENFEYKYDYNFEISYKGSVKHGF